MEITATGVCKDFIRQSGSSNRFTAVKPTDLRIEPGKLTLLMGRSGSGKSTLLNMLAGLLTPTAGRVQYGDTDIYAQNDEELSRFRSLHIGMIPQGQTAVHSLTVRDNICLTYLVSGKREERIAAYPYANVLAERLGIAGLLDSMPSELSGGELRRVAIARAMIRRPDVIFADEPTCDLDDENTGLVLALLKETAGEGSAVFVVSHERDAIRYADIRLRMDAGIVTPDTEDDG